MKTAILILLTAITSSAYCQVEEMPVEYWEYDWSTETEGIPLEYSEYDWFTKIVDSIVFRNWYRTIPENGTDCKHEFVRLRRFELFGVLGIMFTGEQLISRYEYQAKEENYYRAAFLVDDSCVLCKRDKIWVEYEYGHYPRMEY